MPEGAGAENVKALCSGGELLKIPSLGGPEGGGRGGLIFNDEGMDCAHMTFCRAFDALVFLLFGGSDDWIFVLRRIRGLYRLIVRRVEELHSRHFCRQAGVIP